MFLTFRDTDKKFELHEDLLKRITVTKLNVDLDKIPDKKVTYEFAKEMHFDEKDPGNESDGEMSLIRLLKSSNIMISASGVSSSHKKLFLKYEIFII